MKTAKYNIKGIVKYQKWRFWFEISYHSEIIYIPTCANRV